MSVDVQVGDVNIQASDRAFYGINDAVVNVTVSASSPSNPRKDAIVAYIDLSVVSSASNDNPGVLKFLAVAGTPAGSPVDPSAGTIQTAVGGTNPYVILARVDVATSSTSVVNANITDRRNPSALAVPYLYGGASNTNGHLVPNVADDTVALLAATQTLTNKTLDTTTQLGIVKGLVRNRQGGTTGDATWITAGTSNTDTSTKGVFIQVGSVNSSAATDVAVTFPAAFTQAPLIQLTAMTGATANVFGSAITPTTTGFSLRAISDSGTRAAETFSWLAIGQ